MGLLECVEIEPAGAPAGSVIWLHGLGANGHDFEPIVPMLGLPEVRFVFPHAPEMPVTLNRGMVMPSWYDIVTLDDVPDREDAADVLRATGWVEDLIAREVQRGSPPERIVLAGFSQGGAMALHTAVRHPRSLCGLMVLSGYLVRGERLEAEATAANRDTPALFCHGRFDPVVPMARGRRAYDAFRARATRASPDVRWHEYAMEHQVCPEEIAVIASWLAARFA